MTNPPSSIIAPTTLTLPTYPPHGSRGSHPAVRTTLPPTQKSYTNEAAKQHSSKKTTSMRSRMQTANEAASQCPAYCASPTGTTHKSGSGERSRRYLWRPGRDRSTFTWWKRTLEKLGYEIECLFLNSQFAPPCPQSCDRIYIVAWHNDNTRPVSPIVKEVQDDCEIRH